MYFGVISPQMILKAMELYDITKREIYMEKKRGLNRAPGQCNVTCQAEGEKPAVETG